MSNLLSNLEKLNTYTKPAKRVGRGGGSGKGFHVTGRGANGQKSRSGGKTKLYFEGGQMPFIKRLPFREGFRNINTKNVFGINLNTLSDLDLKLEEITPEYFYTNKVLGLKSGVLIKILSKGKLTKKLNLKGFSYSAKAKQKIEKVGGTAI